MVGSEGYSRRVNYGEIGCRLAKADGRRGWFSLRTVGSAQFPELRPSGVGTTRRHLLREYGVQRLVRLGSGAARAPRFCETNRIGFGAFFHGTTEANVSYDGRSEKMNPVRLAKPNRETGESLLREDATKANLPVLLSPD